jgi:hypothetical protein
MTTRHTRWDRFCQGYRSYLRSYRDDLHVSYDHFDAEVAGALVGMLSIAGSMLLICYALGQVLWWSIQ